MTQEIAYGAGVRARMLVGVNAFADTVKVALGPQGLKVALADSGGKLVFSSDGAAIAEHISFEDRFENMGAQIMREVCTQTREVAGDGSTTAAVLTQYLIQIGFRNLEAGADPLALKRGIQGAAYVADAALSKLTLPVQDREGIEQVATSAAHDASIGADVAEAFSQVGLEGVITIDESGSLETNIELEEGMQFERGFLSPAMTDDNGLKASLDHPYILLTDQTIADPAEIASLLEAVAANGGQLLIVAEDVVGAALATLILNKQKGVLKSVAVQPPAYGQGRRMRMDDLAVFTGATYVTPENGIALKNATMHMLGQARSVHVGRKSTVIEGGMGAPEELEKRKASLRTLIAQTDYDFLRAQHSERLAKMTSGVANIKLGAPSESILKEKKIRYESAINAARSAASEGVLPGAGLGYVAVSPAIRAYADTLAGDVRSGALMLLRVLECPTRHIVRNAGYDDSLVIDEMRKRKQGTGLDVVSGNYVNMLEAGIIDPAQAVRLALASAASAASVLLCTEVAIASPSGNEPLKPSDR